MNDDATRVTVETRYYEDGRVQRLIDGRVMAEYKYEVCPIVIVNWGEIFQEAFK